MAEVTEQYLQEITKALPEKGLQKRKYLSFLEHNLENYSLIHPTATLEDYRSFFGSSDEVAEGFNYYSGFHLLDVKRNSHFRNTLIRILAMILCLMILVTFTGLWLWGHSAFGSLNVPVMENENLSCILTYRTPRETLSRAFPFTNTWGDAS